MDQLKLIALDREDIEVVSAHLQDAVLVDALVDSRQTLALDLPEGERRIIAGPVRLSQQPDLAALRRQMGTAQSKIGTAVPEC